MTAPIRQRVPLPVSAERDNGRRMAAGRDQDHTGAVGGVLTAEPRQAEYCLRSWAAAMPDGRADLTSTGHSAVLCDAVAPGADGPAVCWHSAITCLPCAPGRATDQARGHRWQARRRGSRHVRDRAGSASGGRHDQHVRLSLGPATIPFSGAHQHGAVPVPGRASGRAIRCIEESR